MTFRDRADAGRQLARQLHPYQGADIVVVGLPRGGVPVAFEVARQLGAPLDVIIVRKLGVPSQPELAMGAIGEGGARVLDDVVLRAAQISRDELAVVESAERRELDRRARRFRQHRPRIELAGRTVLIVDDGIATGSTARAACQVARAEGATRVVLAVPVAPADASTRVVPDADEVVVVSSPEPFHAVGQVYDDFTQVSDQEVIDLLVDSLQAEDPRADPAPANGVDTPARREDVEIVAGHVRLPGRLEMPENPIGIVLFAHGSGSTRRSPRNRYVATVLEEAGIGTLLFDLLTATEETSRVNVFDIGLLADRLTAATAWVKRDPDLDALPIGYFGASTGAAAALWAAAADGGQIAAIVSTGGRPDLAGDRLGDVTAPTLLIVGSVDSVVLELNRAAATRLRCPTELTVIEGATHLFEEPGTLVQAADAAARWFGRNLRRPGPDAEPAIDLRTPDLRTPYLRTPELPRAAAAHPRPLARPGA
ncbi:MAG: phosphoribosyltransferase family protein [Acidimicrobiales bacterium]